MSLLNIEPGCEILAVVFMAGSPCALEQGGTYLLVSTKAYSHILRINKILIMGPHSDAGQTEEQENVVFGHAGFPFR